MKGLKNFFKKAALCAAVMMLGAACNKGVIDANDPNGPVGDDEIMLEAGVVGLTPAKALLYMGDDDGKELALTLSEEAVKYTEILWTADPAGIAKVEWDNENGLKAVVKPQAAGTTKIRAEAKPKKGYKLDKEVVLYCDITVTDGLSFDTAEMLLFTDDGINGPALTLKVPETHKQAIADAKGALQWEVTDGLRALIRLGNSSNPRLNVTIGGADSAVTGDVDDNYVAHFTPLSAGQATVKAVFTPTDAGREEGLQDDEAVCMLTVVAPLDITITSGASGAELEANGGQASPVAFNALVTPSGIDAWSPVITWESDNTAVAALAPDTGVAVGVTGLIKGVARINAKVAVRGREKVSNTIVFTVREHGVPEFPVEDITLSKTGTFDLTRGNTSDEITVTLQPPNATEKNVTWKVEPKEALTIVNGADQWHRKFKASGSGTAKVTVTSQDTTNGTISKNFTVNIKALSVDISGQATVTAGSEVVLVAAVTPGDAQNNGVIWSLQGTNADKATITSTNGQTVTIKGSAVSTDTSVTVRAVSTEDSSKSKDFSLMIKPYTFTIKYDNNGGSGVIGSQTVTYGAIPTLDAGAAFTKTDYMLAKWNTKKDGTGTDYDLGVPSAAAGTLGTTPGSDVTLYANWIPDKPSTYTVPGEYTWEAPVSGYYTIEVWGAQGNNGVTVGSGSGGAGQKGGYSKGQKIELKKGDKLTLKVGAAGGGGSGGSGENYGNNNSAKGGAGGSGGGMTAALKGSETLIVAGGGGGGGGGATYIAGLANGSDAGGGGGSGGGYNTTPGNGGGNGGGTGGSGSGAGGGNGKSGAATGIAGGGGGGGGGGSGHASGGGGAGGEFAGGGGGGGGGGYAKVGSDGFASATGQTGVQSGNGKAVITYTP
jgi:hypothetical protein